MNLYQVKSNPQGIERMAEFLRDNYISIGYPGIGDLDDIGPNELKERLAQAYEYERQELLERADELVTFVQEMQDGDYVLVAENDSVYLGDVGDYYYVDASDSMEDGLCHRRGVTWLQCIPRSDLNEYVYELLSYPGAIKKFEYPISYAQLERGIEPKTMEKGRGSGDDHALVDRQTINEALAILQEAMRSDDADRRERAATAILQYASSRPQSSA
jgi:predicted Mrr-cat superfamily restriction endonuclease